MKMLNSIKIKDGRILVTKISYESLEKESDNKFSEVNNFPTKNNSAFL
jgi:hypothetical protein